MFGKHLFAAFILTVAIGLGCDGPSNKVPPAPSVPSSGLGGGGGIGGGSPSEPYSPRFFPLDPPLVLIPQQELNPPLPIQAVEIAPVPVQLEPVDR